MPSLPAARASNEGFCPSYRPVAVFLGGTSGIGQAMAEAFAKYTKGDAHIILVGRNRAAAESIIASLPKPTAIPGIESDWSHKFLPCDATLMKNVHATTTELLAQFPKINFLVMSPGFLHFGERQETEEGIDKKLALSYYARWKFTNDLIPSLRKAKDAGEDAKVMSVLGAGKGKAIDLNDLGLRKTYTGLHAMFVLNTYNDLMVEEFATREPDIAFTHIFPGFVNTPIFNISHWALKPLLSPILTLMIWLFSTSQDDCAEYMLFALLDGEKGFFRKGEKGDDIGMQGYFGSVEARTRLWEHTAETMKVALMR